MMTVMLLLRGGMPPSEAVSVSTNVVSCSNTSDWETTMTPPDCSAKYPGTPWETDSEYVMSALAPRSRSVATVRNTSAPTVALFCSTTVVDGDGKDGL
jgi:hypothetical protein